MSKCSIIQENHLINYTINSIELSESQSHQDYQTKLLDGQFFYKVIHDNEDYGDFIKLIFRIKEGDKKLYLKTTFQGSVKWLEKYIILINGNIKINYNSGSEELDLYISETDPFNKIAVNKKNV